MNQTRATEQVQNNQFADTCNNTTNGNTLKQHSSDHQMIKRSDCERERKGMLIFTNGLKAQVDLALESN